MVSPGTQQQGPSQLSGQPSGQPSAWLIASCLLAVYVIWGTTYFAIKVGIEGAPPFFLIGTRFMMAGGLLLGWQALRGRPMPAARQWRGAALVGFLLLVVGNGGVAVAEHWVSSGATVALISVMPLATALWSGVFGEWPRRMEWGAIALGGVGAAVMLTGRDLQGSVAGTLVILLGITCWSLGTVLSRRLDIPHGPTGFGAEMLVAGVMALAVSAAIGEEHLDLFARQCAQANYRATGTDGWQKLAGILGEDDDVDRRGRLFEEFEEGVSGFLHEVGGGEDEDLARSFARQRVRAINYGADLA